MVLRVKSRWIPVELNGVYLSKVPYDGRGILYKLEVLDPYRVGLHSHSAGWIDPLHKGNLCGSITI